MAMPPRGFLVRLLLVCHFLKSLLRFLIPKRLINSFLATSPPVKGNPRTTTATAPPPPPPAAAAKPTRPLPSPVALSAELERLFQTFDRNGDGRITREELTDSLESLGIFIPERDLEATIRKVDADGDGCLDADEFRELYAAIMTAREDGAEEEDDGIKEAFDVFDENGDGFITVEELRSVLGSLGLRQGRTAEDCRRMIGTVDADGDGRVDFQEFREMMRRGGPVAAF